MNKPATLEIEKRLAYSFAGGAVAYGMAVTKHAHAVDLMDSEEEHRETIAKLKTQSLERFPAADIIRELVQPFGKYADDPETKSEKYDGPAKEYLKHIWKKMYSEYVNKDSFETDVAFARQAFTCPHDVTSDIFELMNYAREHGASDGQMLDTMLSE